ncbi:bifunctional oligoribonuclease/PAP phosphatase NrnA [bacterium]|nr:bifunctional oligoribonuclease/PAP phosphatase NrnA [bacterium]
MYEQISQAILSAKNILLTTHRQCDGDGLGAELAMYHALRALGKEARVLNVDATPNKYRFLTPDSYIQYYDTHHDPIQNIDLAIIFDTNDYRLLEPLFAELEKKCRKVLFVDHHPVLKTGPEPTPGSVINTKAASTGEMVYDIIKILKAPMNRDIAKALYTSIAFDTQLFRYVRNSYRSHEIAAELLRYETEPSIIHKHVFGNFTALKLKYLSKVLSEMEFFYKDRLVFLHITSEELAKYGLSSDDSRDLVDMMMNIETVEIAIVIREDESGFFKVSIRSKGHFEVNALAESLGGGGHVFSAGASVKMPAAELKKQIVEHFSKFNR